MRIPFLNALAAVLFTGAPVFPVSGQAIEGPGNKNWIMPVRIPVFLSGNFAEPRSNHFHSGIDIKTNGATGIPVYAVSSGSVSRIKVEPGGYGRALYIRHLDGFTSVYAHLQSFSGEVEKYVRAEQYRRESFAVDLFPEPARFPVRQGDIIARTGNSGSSEGPHLHFEIRETSSENPVNPLVKTITVKDQIPPVINQVYSFSLSGRQEWIKPVNHPVILKEGIYRLATSTPLPLDNISGLGIESWDLLDGSPNRCGVYRIQGYLDGELFYDFMADEFSFAETRYLNSFIDYKQYMTHDRTILRLFIEPCNELSLYRYSKNRGHLEVKDNKVHEVRLVVEDAAGNRSVALVPVSLNPSQFVHDPGFLPFYDAYFSAGETNVFTAEGVEIRIPARALYDDIYFQYQASGPGPGCYSKIHSIHRQDVPLHQYYRLAIEATGLPAGLKNQAIIACQGPGRKMIPSGGVWEGNFLVTRTRTFGQFYICVDTLKPEIRPINFKNQEDLNKVSSLRFDIRDDFSGISTYRGEVDDKWALMEYHPKNNLLEYKLDPERIGTGKVHTFVLQVSDLLKNTTTYRTTFYR